MPNIEHVSLNLNTAVTARLTEYGRTLWYAHHTQFGLKFPVSAQPDADGTVRTQLWELMAALRPALFNGADQTVVQNTLLIRVDLDTLKAQ